MKNGRLAVLDPRSDPAWEEFVARDPRATVFHTPHWARALADAYGFQPRYHALLSAGGEVEAAMPLMLVRSPLTGRRLVGLPFSDLCPPLVPDADSAALLCQAVREDARRLGADYVEVRGGDLGVFGRQGFAADGETYVRHLLPLPAELGDLERRLHDSARRGVRKALRCGVRVRRCGAEAMPAFYRLYTCTRRRQGLASAPYRFFAAIGERLLARGLGALLLAEADGEAVAANLVLWWREAMVYKANVSLAEALEMRPNNLLMWATIELAHEMGLRWLDMGRTDAGHEGLRRFKSLWGAREEPLPYLYYPAPTATGRRRALGSALRLAARTLPGRLYGALGLLYRHLA